MSTASKIILLLLLAALVAFFCYGCALLDKVAAWIPCPPAATPTPTAAPIILPTPPVAKTATPAPVVQTPTPIPGGNPVIVGQMDRWDKGWGGGCAVRIRNGAKELLECAATGSGGVGYIAIKDMTGKVIGEIEGPYDQGYHDLDIDAAGNIWATCWGGPVVCFPGSGGAAIKSFNLTTHKYGIQVDGNYLWVACHVNHQIICVDAVSGKVVQVINVKSNLPPDKYDNYPLGLVKRGDHFWVGAEGSDYNIPGVVYRIDGSGNPTGESLTLPPGKNSYEAGGCAIDGEFVWLRGGKGLAIYKISGMDVGDIPISRGNWDFIPENISPPLDAHRLVDVSGLHLELN